MHGLTGLVLVNGPRDSVQGPRAQALFQGDMDIVYKTRGRFHSVPEIWSCLRTVREGWIYCIDLGVPAAFLAAVRRYLPPRVRLALELGDPMGPLLAGQPQPWLRACADLADRVVPGLADRLVFRGSYLARYFRKIMFHRGPPVWTWLPDGVDTARFRPRRQDPAVNALRRRH